MKRNFGGLLGLAVATAAFLGLTGVSHAGVLYNVQYSNNAVTNYTGAGVLGVASQTWNQAIGSAGPGAPNLTNILNSSGGSSTVDVSVAGDDNAGGGWSSNGLLTGFIYDAAGGANLVVTITGLTPGGTYELVAYSSFTGGGSAAATFTGALTGTTTDSNNTTFTSGANYIENTSAIAVGGDLTFTLHGTSSFNILNGIQFESVSTTPEPASLGLLGLGALGLLLRRKSRKVA